MLSTEAKAAGSPQGEGGGEIITSRTLTIVPVIGATAEPWEAAEGPPLKNLGTGRCNL